MNVITFVLIACALKISLCAIEYYNITVSGSYNMIVFEMYVRFALYATAIKT